MNPAQHGILATELTGAAGSAYHLALAIVFDGDLDRPALADACAAVVARHEALRQVVVECAGEAYLRPGTTTAALRYADVTVTDEVARPFALTSGPLVRFTLIGEGPARHRLLVVAHHLVFDGRSKEILVGELASHYNDARAPDPPPSPQRQPPSERTRRASDPAAREFWRRRWREPGSPLLPGLTTTRSDRTRGGGPAPDDRDGEIRFTVDGAAVRRAAGRLGVTRFEVLFTAVHALLRRYGDPAPVVAVDVSTRDPDTANRIGMYANELPIAVHADDTTGDDTTGDDTKDGGTKDGDRVTFARLVGLVRAELRAAYEFRGVCVARAVGGVRPRAALTPVSVSYRQRVDTPSFTGVRANVEWSVFSGTTRALLDLHLLDEPDRTNVGLRYATAALDHTAAERIALHLRTLLAAAMADPETRVVDLPLLPAGTIPGPDAWAASSAVDHPPDATIDGMFSAQVLRTPDRMAVTCGQRSLGYAELDAAVDRLAARLRRAGAGVGALVAIQLPRCLEMLVAVLAVLRTGAAYVPVDPAYPRARVDLILADANPALTITDPSWVSSALVGSPDPDDGDAVPAGTDGRPAAGVDAGSGRGPGPDTLAYVMYTSGSTGRPKGVAVSHRALANLLRSLRDLLVDGPGQVWLAATSLSFDISAVELFLPVVTGGRTVIAPPSAVRDGAALVRLIRTGGITHVQATPSGWRMLLDHDLPAGRTIVALSGGEALPLPLAREVRGRVGRLFNLYGPTETTIWSTVDEIVEPVVEVTIGRPVANTRVLLLDPRGRPVPVGLPGELYIGGAGLADGYLGRPELTATRFVPDPYGPPGARVYRTGDLARYLPDGRLCFLGRIDNQIKIRGHRVEPGEIEACLLDHPAVSQAVVTLKPVPTAADPTRSDGMVGGVAHTVDAADRRLVAYLVPRGAPPAPAQLREHVARCLPAVMVPTSWVVLDRFPLTPNGKLDRSALPDPPDPRDLTAGGRSAAGLVAVPTDDPVTVTLRRIWREVLRIDDVGDDEDLFDLGGHSLTITQIAARVQRELGVGVSLDAFYDTPTIADIAAVVRQVRGDGDGDGDGDSGDGDSGDGGGRRCVTGRPYDNDSRR